MTMGSSSVGRLLLLSITISFSLDLSFTNLSSVMPISNYSMFEIKYEHASVKF